MPVRKPSRLNNQHINALEYVRNTNGGATKTHFLEDHEPIGEMLWNILHVGGLVTLNERGYIFLTARGKDTLMERT